MNEVATVGLDEFFWNGRDLELLAARVSVNWTGVLAEAGWGGVMIELQHFRGELWVMGPRKRGSSTGWQWSELSTGDVRE